MMFSGGAPTSSEVLDFIKICFCSPIIEGYGLTECCGGALLTHLKDGTSGHVGGPLACVKFRLRDIPEMNYLCTD